METEEIKKAILALSDSEIEPLYLWLKDYYDGDVWDRQMEADIERLGPEQWGAALREGMAQRADERQKAVLRLMNDMQFKSGADRDQCLKDFELVVGQALLASYIEDAAPRD